MSSRNGHAMETVVADEADLTAFLCAEFSQTRVSIEAVFASGVTVRQIIGFGQLRPGGEVSGPALMGVADVALCLSMFALLGSIAQRLSPA